MKTFLYLSLLFLAFGNAKATTVPPRELSELVAESDHIIIATVTKVDMIDKNGRELTKPESKTGPGIENTLRLHLSIKKGGILKTNKKPFPQTLVIPLWKMWHYSLGQWKSEEDKTMIFLLKGDQYLWVYPAGFMQPISAREEIEQLIRKSNPDKK